MRHSPTREQCGAITALYLVTIYIYILGVVENSIYILLFYKPIQGPSVFMCSFIFYPWSMLRSEGLHIFSFAC